MRRQLGYAVLVVGVVAGLLLLSLVVGDRGGVARIAWLIAGLVLGSLWALRGRLPLLGDASPRAAVGAWLGVVLAGIVTVALAPTALPSSTASVAGVAETSSSPQRTLRPAPPTAVRRTGTVGPAAQARPQPKPSPSPLPPVMAQGAGPPDAGTASSTPEPRPSPAAEASPAVVRAAPAGSPAAARAVPKPSPALPPGFDPNQYLGQGNAYDCDHLASQAEAQAILRADPTDPNVIDNDRDGLACESNPPPRDTRRVPRPSP